MDTSKHLDCNVEPRETWKGHWIFLKQKLEKVERSLDFERYFKTQKQRNLKGYFTPQDTCKFRSWGNLKGYFTSQDTWKLKARET